MAITAVLSTSAAWTVLATSGQTGSCWLQESDVNYDQVDVRLLPSVGAPVESSLSTDILKAKRLLQPKSNQDCLYFSLVNSTETLYARCRKSGDTAVICVNLE